MSELIHEVQNYAGGKWHSPTGDETAELWSPASGEVIAKVRFSSHRDIDDATAFTGWGNRFFGDLHAHDHHAIEFFTQTKVVVERWP